MKFGGRRDRWSLGEAITGLSSRLLPAPTRNTRLPVGPFEGMLVPEKAEGRSRIEISMIRSRLRGANVAALHDLIPTKLPELVTQIFTTKFAEYLDTLLCDDGIAAVSESTRRDLIGYRAEHWVKNHPRVVTICPAIWLPLSDFEHPQTTNGRSPIILMVATIERRKNHLTVLDTCEYLWKQGYDFDLVLLGRLRDAEFGVIARVDALGARPARSLARPRLRRGGAASMPGVPLYRASFSVPRLWAAGD